MSIFQKKAAARWGGGSSPSIGDLLGGLNYFKTFGFQEFNLLINDRNIATIFFVVDGFHQTVQFLTLQFTQKLGCENRLQRFVVVLILAQMSDQFFRFHFICF
jgi:hypothetical protein